MTPMNLFPSLDTDGWTNTPIKIADYLFSHFFLSDYSQTAMFPDNIASFAYIVEKNNSDSTGLISDIESTLARYFSAYFNNVTVQAAVTQDTTVSINAAELKLYAAFEDRDGNPIVLSRLVTYEGLKVSNIISISNHG